MSRLLAPYRIPDERRDSKTAFVPGIRKDVDGWRAQGYPGATETTKRLLTWWFETDHKQLYYFCQREAIETLIYLYEVRRLRRMSAMAGAYNEGVAVKPREDRYARYVFKMATGSGKTKVMSLAIVWSYLNAINHPENGLPKSFLLIAPNVIVYERLIVDFGDGKIFRDDPLIPPEWKSAWQFSVITRDDPGYPTTPGALFVTNVHRLYEGRGDGDTGEPDAMTGVLGPKVRVDLAAAQELRDRILSQGPVMVLNDEGHHLHSADLKWKEIIDTMHDTLAAQGGLAGQLDFTATPKHQDGRLFREIVCDYPIAQAVDDGIVKTPIIGELTGAEDYDSLDASVRFRDRINAGIAKWRDFDEAMGDDPTKKPLLFIMAENTDAADQISEYLQTLPDMSGRVLTIHTNAKGEIVEGKTRAKKEEIEILREEARKVDSPDNPYAAIVSVLMLREGWDVRNVCVIVPLRPYTAKANILPEQTLGRGLRRMTPPASGDKEQVVVIEHAAFKDFWKKELEEEGLQIEWVPVDKIKPEVKTVVVDKTREQYDIAVPLLTPLLVRSVARLDDLDVAALDIEPMALPEGKWLGEEKMKYRGKHMFTLELVEEAEFDKEFPIEPSGYISVIVRLVEKETRLTGQFARLAPLVKEAIETRLFGQQVSMDDEVVMRSLNRPEAKRELFVAFVTAINAVSIETQTVALDQQWIRASATNPFTTSRRCVEGARTVFNLVPVANNLEEDFTNFLESPDADDVLAYFKNETAVHFEIEYQSVTGGIRKYIPDFIVRCGDGTTYVVETKGQEDLEVERKDMRTHRWCQDASALTDQPWQFLKVPEGMFRAYPVKRFVDLVRVLS